MTGSAGAGSVRRARRAFWTLTAVALLAMGALSSALAATPGPLTGVFVMGAGTVLVLALGLAARVLLALERARAAGRPPRQGR